MNFPADYTDYFACLMVNFYRFWHGKLHLPGAGRLLQWFAGFFVKLQDYPLALSPQKFIRVDFRDVSAFAWANYLLGEGLQEDALIAAMTKRPRAGGVFWDVGANAGLVSYSMAEMVRPSHIEFFEPQPFLLQAANDALAGTVSHQGHRTALSDYRGTGCFLMVWGESTKARLGGDFGAQDSREVEIQTGVSLVAKGNALPPDLIKIDTEGHEQEVLRGIRETIARYQPDIAYRIRKSGRWLRPAIKYLPSASQAGN